MMLRAGFVAAVIAGAAWPGGALAQNATTPGAVTSPSPTTQAIALAWAINCPS